MIEQQIGRVNFSRGKERVDKGETVSFDVSSTFEGFWQSFQMSMLNCFLGQGAQEDL